MPNEILQMSLKTAPFQFAEFKPAQYTPVEPDLNILNRSMEKVENRMYQARVARDKIDETLGVARSKLNPSEYAKFDKEANDVRAKIDEQTQIGNFGQAILTASDLGNQFARNEYWANAASTQEEYAKKQKEIEAGPYTNYTKRYYNFYNPYVNNGTGHWTEAVPIVADKSFADVWAISENRTPTKEASSSNSISGKSTTFIDAKGNTTTDPTKAAAVYSESASHTKSSSGYVEKTKEALVSNFMNMVTTDSNLGAAIRQNFTVMQWLYKDASSRMNDTSLSEAERAKATQEYNEAKDVLTNSDGLLFSDTEDGYKQWLSYNANKYAANSAYRHTSSSHERSTGTNFSDTGLGVGRKATTDQYRPDGQATVDAAKAKDEKTPNTPSYNAQDISEILGF